MPERPEHRTLLTEAKLRALVRSGWGDVAATPASLPLGAALRSADGTGWVLPTPERARAGHGILGGALGWALREGLDRLHLLVDEDAGTLARQAAEFATPVTVWRIEGTTPVEAGPAPLPPEPVLTPEVLAMASTLTEVGADAVPEHGRLIGEVLGLEVARIEAGPDGTPRLAVGVGRYERELHDERHLGEPPVAVLAQAVATVRALRRPGIPAHTANQLAPERWLRTVVIAHPALAGAAGLEPIAPVTPAEGLSGRAPAAAVGTDPDGHPIVVVCSAGVDLGLVPTAADARLTAAARLGLEPSELRLVLAVPAGDDHPVTRRLAAGLREPAEIVTVPADWRSLSFPA
jgi:hypothetical protein